MLVLSRRVGEEIVIGDSIVITVLAVSGAKARLGIEAPRNVPVNRSEVHWRLRAESRSHVHDGRRNPKTPHLRAPAA